MALSGPSPPLLECRLLTHFGHSVGRAFGPVIFPDGPYAFRATDIPRRKTEIDQCVALIVLAFTSDPAAPWMDRKLAPS